MRDARHAVIIGSPGVGKSAVTRYLARTAAKGSSQIERQLGWSEDLLPIRVPLAAYADALQQQQGIALAEFVIEHSSDAPSDPMKELLRSRLQKGRCLVLLDGVDEVTSNRARAVVVQAIDVFMSSYAANRIVVTSRPYGYVRIAGDVPHFQMRNFSRSQIAEFVQKYYAAVAQKLTRTSRTSRVLTRTRKPSLTKLREMTR